MVSKLSISMRDRTKQKIEKKKGNLSTSEYIEECLLNYWDLKRIK